MKYGLERTKTVRK